MLQLKVLENHQTAILKKLLTGFEQLTTQWHHLSQQNKIKCPCWKTKPKKKTPRKNNYAS